jgi:hypothetical protein
MILTTTALIALVAASPWASTIATLEANEFVELVASGLAVQISIDQAQKVIDHFKKADKGTES